MQNPFDELEPDPRAVEAARALMQRLPVLDDGKMFGVLLVDGAAPLHAFSGDAPLEGFAPHVYDAVARARLEPEADRLVKSLTARLEATSLAGYETQRLELERRRTALRAEHAARRAARHALPRSASSDEASRADKRERRTFDAEAHAQLEAFAPLLRRHEALLRLRRIVSRVAMQQLHDTYRLDNWLGETTTLRALFPGAEPPWGAGECAAVKLLQHAIRARRTPIALAEFWWGPPPQGGGRVHGTFYPACRTKCGPVLPFLLRGLDVAPRRAWRSTPSAFETLYQDAHLAVVCKPAGLLSVPGKEESDSVLERLRAAHPAAQLVHRLDLDTSGLLVAALDAPTHRALQAQFLARHVEKRYVAWLEGEVPGEHGTVSLPLCVDLEHRPRQRVDFEHGRESTTDWQVLERASGRTKVALFPRTGRTHQLRVHSAHRDGLAAPIVGDRLYGLAGERLLLHAEQLTFTHPATDGRVTFRVAAPF